jgi:thioredoxin 1
MKMKSFFIPVLMLFVAALWVLPLSAQTTAQQKKTMNETSKKAPHYKVTFIELGSVRCIPCQKMQPIMKSIREKYPTQVNVIFYDVWTKEGHPFAQQYNIEVIPTQVFLDANGKEFYRHQGYFPEDELINVLKKQGVR